MFLALVPDLVKFWFLKGEVAIPATPVPAIGLLPSPRFLASSPALPRTSVKLASKRNSRSRSRTRSRAKHQPEPEPLTQERIYANFVVPLAGLLGSIAARFYDMGGSPAASSKPVDEEQNGNERTPLLPRSERGSEESSVSRREKAARWMVHNAVIVFTTLLIATAIIILCVLFGGKSHTTAPRAPLLWSTNQS